MIDVTCAGACCSVFPMNKDQPVFHPEKGVRSRSSAYILDMLIPLTRRQALARSRRLGYPDPPRYGKKYALFTCRHWDEETRLCGAYEARPAMCSDYPYGRSCERGCGYTSPEPVKGNDSCWDWDADANGWRPKSSDSFLWDAGQGVLKPVPVA